ncbi:hypothetical protein SCHPADRAFT_911623 [Schizopora paradoxa]|uniref:Uncharacterized protein n=1 Tax=Schizopora paradoxa TaxID=27342 RepID=A0A0H2QY62_9AGAM|nr:hypothetical protein SCHPADRAFT_911623 [Schizopora paradoxa]
MTSPPNRVEDNRKISTQKNNVATSSSAGGDGDETDSESYPKLRKKQRRRTGERAEKKESNFMPVSISESVWARFEVEGETADQVLDH